MSKKINAYGAFGYSPYITRANNADRSAVKPARVEKAPNSQPSEGVNSRGPSEPSNDNALTTAEQRMILREFPEDPNLSLRLYGPNRDAQTINPSAVGNQIDVQG